LPQSKVFGAPIDNNQSFSSLLLTAGLQTYNLVWSTAFYDPDGNPFTVVQASGPSGQAVSGTLAVGSQSNPLLSFKPVPFDTTTGQFAVKAQDTAGAASPDVLFQLTFSEFDFGKGAKGGVDKRVGLGFKLKFLISGRSESVWHGAWSIEGLPARPFLDTARPERAETRPPCHQQLILAAVECST
jgi:hypothetical protein